MYTDVFCQYEEERKIHSPNHEYICPATVVAIAVLFAVRVVPFRVAGTGGRSLPSRSVLECVDALLQELKR